MGTTGRFLWNAEIVEHTDKHYILKNKQYNANIRPGDKITIGFNYANGISEPTGYRLFGFN
ncbi:MAG: cellulose binding domain-containing protein [Lachnospiraceae bacterium]|nr:cellulose binding domain-containing protein [Lachnospiraceae bacterium]